MKRTSVVWIKYKKEWNNIENNEIIFSVLSDWEQKYEIPLKIWDFSCDELLNMWKPDWFIKKESFFFTDQAKKQLFDIISKYWDCHCKTRKEKEKERKQKEQEIEKKMEIEKKQENIIKKFNKWEHSFELFVKLINDLEPLTIQSNKFIVNYIKEHPDQWEKISKYILSKYNKKENKLHFKTDIIGFSDFYFNLWLKDFLIYFIGNALGEYTESLINNITDENYKETLNEVFSIFYKIDDLFQRKLNSRDDFYWWWTRVSVNFKKIIPKIIEYVIKKWYKISLYAVPDFCRAYIKNYFKIETVNDINNFIKISPLFLENNILDNYRNKNNIGENIYDIILKDKKRFLFFASNGGLFVKNNFDILYWDYTKILLLYIFLEYNKEIKNWESFIYEYKSEKNFLKEVFDNLKEFVDSYKWNLPKEMINEFNSREEENNKLETEYAVLEKKKEEEKRQIEKQISEIKNNLLIVLWVKKT